MYNGAYMSLVHRPHDTGRPDYGGGFLASERAAR